MKVWDVRTGQAIHTLKGHTDEIRSVAISTDGTRIVSGSNDRTVKVWDAQTGQETFSLKGHLGKVTSVAFAADCKQIVSGSGDSTVIVWDTMKGQETFILKGHTRDVKSVGFNREGNRIIAQSEKGEVRSWNAASGEELVPCTDPPPPDGQRQAVSPDGQLRIWAGSIFVHAVRTDDRRPSADLVFAERLHDKSALLRWLRVEAADSEKKQQWFAAAHHLHQLRLLADAGDNPAVLAVRRLRALTPCWMPPTPNRCWQCARETASRQGRRHRAGTR